MVPITFALKGHRLVTAIDHKPKRTMKLQRLANLLHDPSALTVLVDRYDDDWSRLWWVRLRGRARIVEDGPDHAAALDLLAAKYHHYRQRRPSGPVILIDVADWRGWAASEIR